LRGEAAALAVGIQRLSYRDRTLRLQLEVQRAFTQAILAKSNLETAQSLLEQTERMISLNRVRFEQGEISALELNRTEVERLKFKDDVFQANLMLRNAKSSLLALLNSPDLSLEMDIVGALEVDRQTPEHGFPPRAPLSDLIQTALAQRPDLALRVEEKRQSDTEVLLQRALRSRNVTVGGGFKRSGPDNSYVLGLTIPLTLYNRNEGEIVRADAEQSRAANLLLAARRSVELEVRQAYDAAETSRQRVEYVRSLHMKKAEEASRVTFASYNLGGATLIDYLDAQRTYRDTLRIFNQALFDERISLYELAFSIGLGVE
jgi:cobalt-zinc-cadmium efflux system outer membrane protein